MNQTSMDWQKSKYGKPLFVSYCLLQSSFRGECLVPKRHSRACPQIIWEASPRCSLGKSRPRAFWVETDRKEVFTAGLESGLKTFLFRASSETLLNAWEDLALFDAVRIDESGVINIDTDNGQSGILATCCNADDVDAMLQRLRTCNRGDVVVMDAVDGWRVIPTENLIAAQQQDDFPCKTMVVVPTAEEASRMLTLLDVGVDGVVLRTDSMEEVRLLSGVQKEMSEEFVGVSDESVIPATVTSVRNIGTGDRVCVDCCSSFYEDEMMFVGNAAGGLFGVLSEAVENSYVNTREFRFNAGPVHAYCLVPGGQTRYLSELSAGDEVVVARSGANGKITTRSVVVGRCKIEQRPLVLVSAEAENGQEYTHFMQNAETCRLGMYGDNGEVHTGCSVARLERGTKIVIRTDSKGRHMGLPIDEYLIER